MKFVAAQHGLRLGWRLAAGRHRVMSHLRKRGWRWLRDFADRRLERQEDTPSVKAALGSMLLRLANRVLEGRLLMVSATGANAGLPFSEATRPGIVAQCDGCGGLHDGP